MEAALARLLASPETSSTFHDPAVHAALQDVRADLRNINKYRDDPAVMTVRLRRECAAGSLVQHSKWLSSSKRQTAGDTEMLSMRAAGQNQALGHCSAAANCACTAATGFPGSSTLVGVQVVWQ